MPTFAITRGMCLIPDRDEFQVDISDPCSPKITYKGEVFENLEQVSCKNGNHAVVALLGDGTYAWFEWEVETATTTV